MADAPKKTEKVAPRVAKPVEQSVVIRPLARKSRTKKRHWGLMLSFLLIVILPSAAATLYLSERAVDQYASTVAFTVRSEDVSSAADLLGGIGQTLGGSGGAGSDADILYEFIRSQSLVKRIDDTLNLRDFYSRYRDVDPLFGFDPSGTIEDLTDYWQRMVRISYDAGSGLMELRVLAFDADEAQKISNAIFSESTTMINELSAIAREDATRYASEDLDLAVERLKQAREALTAFRISSEIVDPTADVQGQMGLLSTLQVQQADALIEFDLLSASTTREGDPRLEQASRRITTIEKRIREERKKFGVGLGGEEGDESYAKTIAEFERLAVDREFAEQAYAATLSAFDAARAEANRQSRYLAAYIKPTKAEKSEFPNRPLLVSIVGFFGFLIWAVSSLVYYALRDRR